MPPEVIDFHEGLAYVDERGLADRSPDYRTFNARTLAPTVAMRALVSPGNDLLVSTAVALSWSGEDPLDKATVESPLASRWTVVSTRGQYGQYEGFPDSLYSLPDSRWSPWRAWDAADGSGTNALLEHLQLRPGDLSAWYLFALQARDAAGAVTPVFDLQTSGRRHRGIPRSDQGAARGRKRPE